MIGKAVVEMLLQKGYNVIGTDTAPAPFEDNDNFSFVQCNITDKEKITGVLNGSKIDMLIHLACTVDNDFPDVLSSDEEKPAPLWINIFTRLQKLLEWLTYLCSVHTRSMRLSVQESLYVRQLPKGRPPYMQSSRPTLKRLL